MYLYIYNIFPRVPVMAINIKAEYCIITDFLKFKLYKNNQHYIIYSIHCTYLCKLIIVFFKRFLF